jgi:hypothetical protein
VRRKSRDRISGDGAETFREVSAYSMDYPDSASVAAWQDTRRQEQVCSKLTVDQIPRLLRKTCNLPVPTVIAHGKLSSYVRYQLSPRPNKLSGVGRNV